MTILAVALATVLFTAFMVWVIMRAAARFGRWPALAAKYPPKGAAPEPKLYLGYLSLRGFIGINGAAIVSSDARGLHLSTWPYLMSWAFPPVWIPWSAIQKVEQRRALLGMGAYYRLELRGLPEVDLRMRDRTFRFVEANAARAGVKITAA